MRIPELQCKPARLIATQRVCTWPADRRIRDVEFHLKRRNRQGPGDSTGLAPQAGGAAAIDDTLELETEPMLELTSHVCSRLWRTIEGLSHRQMPARCDK
ncbi:hypothetical protein VFPPC_01626 [Pochonia chlamydosporia 170]|uniref:Uncharacterized protein n=1 Tax=Pochonia chlamydosporia 170 TaxID=1380566 RepID=A0A179G969_METCM|nr:hypothetical protein VFPPC_01626 [Pochonia chlamydosporia 170]OAQ74040.1 hypothetical protein VFPPC_01626 [Pochonia chlamydosporia 170]